MASSSVFNLTRFTAVASGDVIPVVDISDTTQSAHGSLDSITVANFFGSIPSPMTQALGTITTSQPALSASQTWNAGGVTFTAFSLAVTSTASAAGSKLIDITSDLGSGAVRRLQVLKNGSTGIGGSASTDTILALNSGNTLTGTSQRGINCQPTFNSTCTVQGISILSQVFTQAAAYTLTDGIAVYVQNASIGAGSTLTNQYGIYVEAMTSGGTLNYAIYTNAGLVRFGGATTIASTLTTTSYIDASAAANGWLVGSHSGTQRIQYGSDAATAFSFLTAANGYAGLFVGTINTNDKVSVGSNGLDLTGNPASAAASHVNIGGATQTTIGANGAASALTANPLGYLKINVAGTSAIVPYYNA